MEYWHRFIDLLKTFFYKDGVLDFPTFLFGEWRTFEGKTFNRRSEAVKWSVDNRGVKTYRAKESANHIWEYWD